jgi:predicted 3-demethylubiquinone-9 3-methyltransferase (glyoxalase superfamily)
MTRTRKISPCLWFDGQAEEAARFYVGILQELPGGDPRAQQCGWLKDRYGISWQVVPSMLDELFDDENSAGSQRAMEAMLQMKKLDVAALQQAYDG